MTEKLKVPIPVIVEGKYDKMKLTSVIEANIITTDGFGIFNKKEKLSLIKRLSEGGVVLLCDSDGAGGVIRRYITGAVPKDKIYNLYIPKIEGKERRKKEPSKEGTLGVEGMSEDTLRKMFETLLSRLDNVIGAKERGEEITKADLYGASLTGAASSSARRDELASHFDLPGGMTPTALLGALNILTDRDGFFEAVREVFGEDA